MCRANSKQWSKYRESDRCQTYLDALAETSEIRMFDLIESRQGQGGGTWVHPQVETAAGSNPCTRRDLAQGRGFSAAADLRLRLSDPSSIPAMAAMPRMEMRKVPSGCSLNWVGSQEGCCVR